MNKNLTAIILVILGIGIYFTFTRSRVKEMQEVRVVNAEYQKAIDNSERLIQVRDNVLKIYNNIDEVHRDRLNKIVPDNVDNVRLIIDVKDDIAARHSLLLRNIKTSSPNVQSQSAPVPQTASGIAVTTPSVAGKTEPVPSAQYGIVTLSFSVTTSYQTFIDFLKDIESSLRIMDVSKLTVATNDVGTYDFGVEVKTYWLKQ